MTDRRVCAEIKAGRDCPVHGKVHGPTGVYTPPDWDAIVDDAVREIDQRWGEPVDDDESAPMDRQIVRETAEAVLRPVVAERDRLRAENERLREAITKLASPNTWTLMERPHRHTVKFAKATLALDEGSL